MEEAKKKEILDTYAWIKVKKHIDNPRSSWEDRYKALEKHHRAETEFLISKLREIVKKYC